MKRELDAIDLAAEREGIAMNTMRRITGSRPKTRQGAKSRQSLMRREIIQENKAVKKVMK